MRYLPKPRRWQRWFAWFPVDVLDGGTVWLAYVERKRHSDGSSMFEYRLIGSSMLSFYSLTNYEDFVPPEPGITDEALQEYFQQHERKHKGETA